MDYGIAKTGTIARDSTKADQRMASPAVGPCSSTRHQPHCSRSVRLHDQNASQPEQLHRPDHRPSKTADIERVLAIGVYTAPNIWSLSALTNWEVQTDETGTDGIHPIKPSRTRILPASSIAGTIPLPVPRNMRELTLKYSEAKLPRSRAAPRNISKNWLLSLPRQPKHVAQRSSAPTARRR